MSSPLVERIACVFWDMVEFPFAPESIHHNVNLALEKMGHPCAASIKAYVDKGQQFPDGWLDVYEKAGITILVKQDDARVRCMLVDILLWVYDNDTYPRNSFTVIVTSKHIKEESYLLTVVDYMKIHGYNVLFTPPLDLGLPINQSRTIQVTDHKRKSTVAFSDGLASSGTSKKQATLLAEPLTCVFWDLVDFPFPNGLHPDLIYKNMKSALEKMGYDLGKVSVMAYVDDGQFTDALLHVYEEAGITILAQQGDKYARSHSMLVDIVSWALRNPATYFEPYNLMVISKDMMEEKTLALEALKDRYYNVLLALPHDDDLSSKNLRAVSFEWLSTSLLDGGKPVDQIQRPDHERKSREETGDFSYGLGSTTYASSDDVVIFWDAPDCPTSDDDDLYLKIKKYLRAKGCLGQVSIMAYFEDKEPPSRIATMDGLVGVRFLLAKGDKNAKVTRILLDILFWAMNNADAPTSLMLISEASKDAKTGSVIQALRERGLHLLAEQALDPCEQLCERLVTLIKERVDAQDSLPIPTYSPYMGLFWNVEGCPANPYVVYPSCVSTLEKKGYTEEAIMKAYVDEETFTSDMLRAYCSHGLDVRTVREGENAKATRISMDMVFWAMIVKDDKSTLTVISKPFNDAMFNSVCQGLKARGFTILLAQLADMITYRSPTWSAKSLLDAEYCHCPLSFKQPHHHHTNCYYFENYKVGQ